MTDSEMNYKTAIPPGERIWPQRDDSGPGDYNVRLRLLVTTNAGTPRWLATDLLGQVRRWVAPAEVEFDGEELGGAPGARQKVCHLSLPLRVAASPAEAAMVAVAVVSAAAARLRITLEEELPAQDTHPASRLRPVDIDVVRYGNMPMSCPTVRSVRAGLDRAAAAATAPSPAGTASRPAGLRSAAPGL